MLHFRVCFFGTEKGTYSGYMRLCWIILAWYHFQIYAPSWDVIMCNSEEYTWVWVYIYTWFPTGEHMFLIRF